MPTSDTVHMGNSSKKSKSSASEIPPLLDEVILHILVFVPGHDLIKKCRLVCSQWKYLVDSPSLWLEKCRREDVAVPSFPIPDGAQINYSEIYMKRPYGRNLLKNWNAQGGLKHWQVQDNGGRQLMAEGMFLVEGIDCAGSEPLSTIPVRDLRKCWATTFQMCRKIQVVVLGKVGLPPFVMDKVKPQIEVSVWTAARYDCGSDYWVTVTLCDSDNKGLAEFSRRRHVDQWSDNSWVEIKHIFETYPEGVRSVVFDHKGKDAQFWAGHYGPKIAAPCVLISPSLVADES